MTLSWVVQNCPEHGQPDTEADGQVKLIGRLMTLMHRIVSFLNKLGSSERWGAWSACCYPHFSQDLSIHSIICFGHRCHWLSHSQLVLLSFWVSDEEDLFMQNLCQKRTTFQKSSGCFVPCYLALLADVMVTEVLCESQAQQLWHSSCLKKALFASSSWLGISIRCLACMTHPPATLCCFLSWFWQINPPQDCCPFHSRSVWILASCLCLVHSHSSSSLPLFL